MMWHYAASLHRMWPERMISPLSGAHLLREASPPGNYRNSRNRDHKQTSLPAGGLLSLLSNMAPVWNCSLGNHKTCVCVCLHSLTCLVCVSGLTFSKVSVCLLWLPLLWLSLFFSFVPLLFLLRLIFPLKEPLEKCGGRVVHTVKHVCVFVPIPELLWFLSYVLRPIPQLLNAKCWSSWIFFLLHLAVCVSCNSHVISQTIHKYKKLICPLKVLQWEC